jgi:UDP:flavonoid glycosyltransferase YjiC (YdhE family)
VKIGLQTWGSDGDIRPFLALAGGLRARGHEVSLVITSVDNKDYSSYGKEMDFEVAHTGTLAWDGRTARLYHNKIIATENSLKQLELIFDHLFNPLTTEMHEAAERLCSENDAIIGHSVHYPVQTAAEKAGKPYATVMMNHAAVYSKHAAIYGVPDLGTWMNPYWNKLFHWAIDRSIGVNVNALRKKVGLPPVTRIADTVWISRRLNLIAETSAIGRKQPDWPDHHHVCGVFTVPGAAEQWTMPKELQQFLEAGPPPVYMTLGSMYSYDSSPENITEVLVQGALLADCRAVVQAPWDKLPNFPDHPQIYKIRKTSHQYVFPHCTAVVHHGGAGTAHSATLHGCPSIVIEHIADQGFFANELHLLGVAPKMLHRRTVTARKLAKSLKTVLGDPGMKKRAEALRESMEKENSVKKAVELIEKHLAS